MKVLLIASFGLLAFVLSGCLTAPVAGSGGLGAVTVNDSNPNAIIDAAQAVFPQSGYTMSAVDYPDSISFDKPAGGFGELMYGSYGTTTSYRVTVTIVPVPGSNSYRLAPRVSRVSDAGEAGFEDSTKMAGLWSGEFKPLLRQVAAQAGGAGPM